MGAKAMPETLHTVALKMVDTLDTMGFLPEITSTLRRAIREPMEEEDETVLLVRGGSWIYHSGCCRSAYRLRGGPVYANDYAGFRLACPHLPSPSLPNQ
jgi:hypothetical protein